MPDPDLLRAWLRQANSDLAAARADADGVAECHRRYWLQQACEKGIKALGIVLWAGRPSDDGRFRAAFLHRHSPLRNLKTVPDIPRSLAQLLRGIEAEIRSIDGTGLILKVDATTPTTDPIDVSYRYPFVDGRTGRVLAPIDYADWDVHQGNFEGVMAAIDRFLKAVRNGARAERVR
jgi:hypothetical protein